MICRTEYVEGVQAGSIFVDDAAVRYIRQQIESEEESVHIDADCAYAEFISRVKPHFIGTEEYLTVKVGKRNFHRPTLNIQGGRMRLAR